MKDRCRSSKYYRERGIVVCETWRGRGGFERFRGHIGKRPTAEHSVDRIDNNGNYEPGNVRWATRTEQMRNTRATTAVTIGGQTKCVTEWAEASGLSAGAIKYRLRRGWPESEVLSARRWTHRAGR